MIETVKEWNEEGKNSFHTGYTKPDVVLMDSAYCSMGRMIAIRACKAAGMEYYDARKLLELVQDDGITAETVNRFESRLSQETIDAEALRQDPDYARIRRAYRKAADIAVSRGRCLIHEKAMPEDFAGRHVLKVFTFTDNRDYIIERAKVNPVYAALGSEEEVLAAAEAENNIRKNWKKLCGSAPWGSAGSYDLCLNTDQLGREYAAAVLAHLLNGD